MEDKECDKKVDEAVLWCADCQDDIVELVNGERFALEAE